MTLNDYEFQLDTAGVVLNQDTPVKPFVDIDRVSGLDSAPYRETNRDHEGADGGFFDAEFEKGRDLILEGTAYCETGNIETFLDEMKANFAPVRSPIPFVYKAPGVDERVLFVKPRGVRFDWETARRIGVTNVQFLMHAEDPRLYDNDLLSVSIPFGGAATTGFGFVNVLDTFNRSVASGGWGTLDTTETWTESFSQLSVDLTTGTGRVTHDAANQIITNTLSAPTGVTDTIARVALRLPVVATGSFIEAGIRLRSTDLSNHYLVMLRWETTGNAQLVIRENVAGAVSSIAGPTTIGTYDGSQTYIIEGQVIGNEIRARGWVSTGTYPLNPTLTVIDTTLTTGSIGIRSHRNTGNTNTTPDTIWEDFRVLRGFGFDLGFGLTVPPSGGTVVVGGNRPTPAILTLTGPVVNPIIFNLTDSKNLVFTDLTLGPTDSLVIDLLNRTVVLNGGTNKRANLQDPDWFLFNPGSTFIVLGGGSGTGSLLIEYRNAWR